MIYKNTTLDMRLDELNLTAYLKDRDTITLKIKDLDYQQEHTTGLIYITSNMFRILNKGGELVINKKDISKVTTSSFCYKGYYYSRHWFEVSSKCNGIQGSASLKDFR